jgi:hypothetical protein
VQIIPSLIFKWRKYIQYWWRDPSLLTSVQRSPPAIQLQKCSTQLPWRPLW